MVKSNLLWATDDYLDAKPSNIGVRGKLNNLQMLIAQSNIPALTNNEIVSCAEQLPPKV